MKSITVRAIFWHPLFAECIIHQELMRRNYGRAAGAFVVYDLARRNSFEHVEACLKELGNHIDSMIPIMLVGNNG